jgi:hypothetical protein
MSEMGQTRPSDRNGTWSVHPLIADLQRRHRHDRFVANSGHDLRGAHYKTSPDTLRFRILPGSAPVWVASSTTGTPFTNTIVRSPEGY